MTESATTSTSSTDTSSSSVCAIVCGHTGATGRALTAVLLADPRIARVVTIGRHAYPEPNDKLLHVSISDVKEIGDAKLPAEVSGMDLFAFWCLGTTRADAGSAERFREIDYGGAEGFVKLCTANPVKNFMLLSSVGASSSSWFLYPKTKGEIEDIVKAAKFARTGIFRPGLLNRGDEARGNEKFVLVFTNGLPVKKLGMAMIRFAFAEGDIQGTVERDEPKVYALSNSEIHKMGEEFEKDHPEVAKVVVPPKNPVNQPSKDAASSDPATTDAKEEKKEGKEEKPDSESKAE